MLFKPHRSKMAVRVETDGPKLYDYGRGGGGRGGPQDPPQDLSLSASKLGGEMVVTLVNPRHDQAMDVDCALRGVSAKPGRAEILHDSSINAFNSFEQPDRLMVKPHEVAVESGRLRVTLPAMSIVTARLAIS
jgi:alpha-N-arabinofuranosidase